MTEPKVYSDPSGRCAVDPSGYHEYLPYILDDRVLDETQCRHCHQWVRVGVPIPADLRGDAEWLERPAQPSSPSEPVSVNLAPADALSMIEAFMCAASEAYERGERDDIEEAMGVLQRLVDATQGAGEDLEWGEPGSCEERGGRDDPSLRRHYGVPHCIYCLQAM